MMYFGLLLFFIFEYVRPGTFVPGLNALHLNSIIPLALVAGSILRTGAVSHESVLRDLSMRVIIIFTGMITLSVVWADVTLYAYNVFTMVLGYALISFVIAKEVTSVRQLKGVFGVLILVHLVLAIRTPALFTSGTRTLIRGGTFLGDGNDFALSVNIALPFALFLLLESKKFIARIFFAALLTVLVLSVVLTQSRGGSIALATVAFYYWLKSDRKFVVATCAAVAVAAVMVVAPPSYFTRMNTISNYEEDGSAQSRITAWKAGARMALGNPLLGVGAGQYPQNFTRYARTPGYTRWMTAHSIYFLMLGEHGFTGITLLLVFIIGNIRANSRVAKEVQARAPDRLTEVRLLSAMNASVLAYATAGAFLSALYYPHLFVISGLLIAARRIVQERVAAAEPTAAQPVAKDITYHWALQAAQRRHAS